ncbi:aminotransferase class IV [Thermodesulfobium sp. 4217-1]|uniref:aminotransferase class IV n=1 Tax=Thermodesulfobium sp. 4217-1 TaxID=3120013 RepID=UPI0032215C6E
MCQFIETIKLYNSSYLNLEYHQKRVNAAQKEFFGKCNIDIESVLPNQENYNNGRFKCRIIYGRGVESISIDSYSIRKIDSLKLMSANEIEYSYKFFDREVFDNLKKHIKSSEEILIIKNNFVTDTSYSNIALYKNGIWHTPESYLLNGTKRQFYLDKGIIKETEITVDKIVAYEKVCLINSMLDLGEICMDVKNIILEL